MKEAPEKRVAMRKKDVRKKHLRWVEHLLWEKLKVHYDVVDYLILEEVIFSSNEKANLARLGRDYNRSKAFMSDRLRRIEKDLDSLMKIIE